MTLLPHVLFLFKVLEQYLNSTVKVQSKRKQYHFSYVIAYLYVPMPSEGKEKDSC